ncbi:MAG: long-chain fatty acid--CoA ligase [Acidobacteriota bacterium]
MENSDPKTLVELLKRAVARDPSREVIRFKQDKHWTAITGERLLERTRNTAAGLYSEGVRKGDRVAILAESGPLWSISDYGILSLGAINVPIYPTQAVHQVEYILEDSDPKLLFISTAKQVKRIDAALRKFPHLRVVTFQEGVEGENIISFTQLETRGARLAASQPDLFDALSSDVRAEDLASIIYTSGTTGEPKGARLTHANITFNAVAAGSFLEIEPDNLMLSFLPMSHIFERMVLYLCLHFGVQINFSGGIETVASDMKEVRPTLMSAVPRLLEKIYSRIQKSASDGGIFKKKLFEWASAIARRKAVLETEGKPIPPLVEFQHDVADHLVYSRLREVVGGRMKRIVSGSAALPSDIALFFIGAGIPVLQGYGLTETSPVISVNTLKHHRVGSVGRPITGVEVRIAEDNEILTRGPHVFEGYFKKHEETREAFVEDDGGRWFKTGDIGKLDEDGFLFITDRKKDLIKTSAGKYVAPQMIEGMIGQSEFVEQSVVIGDRRKYVSVLIVPDFECLRAWAKHEGMESADRERLIEERRVIDLYKAEVSRLTRSLADYEKVKRIALLPREFSIDSGELTPTLKVRRRVVEEKHRELIESLYAGGSD